MAVTFARRAAEMRASEIRELLKYAGRRDMISFGGGLPPNECLPLDVLSAAAARVLGEHGARALQYSPTEGCVELRQKTASRAHRRLGINVDPDEVLITAGAQQALDLTGKVFLDEGDVVVCESPTYLAAIAAFRTFRARFVEVPSDDHGMDVAALDAILARTERVKFVYVIPDFQNPSGRTWSLARRQQLIDVSARHRVPVVEDSPYAELRFEGPALPPVKAMDVHDLVIFLSTYSKILSPGLRVAWMTAPPSILEKYVLAKQATDLNSSTFGQLLVSTYLEMASLDEHIDRVREACRRRRDAMMRALERELPGAAFTRPRGGLFLWVELPDGLSARDLLARAMPRGVAFPPGDAFFPNGGHENTLRLAYSDSPEPRIDEGIARLGAAYRDLRAGRAVA